MENYQNLVSEIIAFLKDFRFLIDSQLTGVFIPGHFEEINEE